MSPFKTSREIAASSDDVFAAISDPARRVAAIITPANEQNLDRLTAEVARGRPSSPAPRS